jgi:hypothetical protein
MESEVHGSCAMVKWKRHRGYPAFLTFKTMQKNKKRIRDTDDEK